MADGKPKSPRATCFHCGEVIQWTNPRLAKEQEEENKVVQAANAAKYVVARAEAKKAGLQDWQATIEEQELPHKMERAYQNSERWYHYREDEGTIVHCPTTREWKRFEKKDRDGYWYGKTALPKEFCHRNVNGQYRNHICNRAVKEIYDGKEPLCGVHLAHEKRRDKEQADRSEAGAIKDYIRTEVKKLCDILQEDFGLEAGVHEQYRYQGAGRGYEHNPSGKVVVDPKALLDLLEETF